MAEPTSAGTTGQAATSGGGGGFAISTGQPKYRVGNMGSAPGIEGALDVSNGDAPIADNQIYISLSAQGLDGQTESAAYDGSWLSGFAAGETRNVSQTVQADPGRWSVALILQDASGQTLVDTDPQEVTVGGAVHHAQTFQDQVFDYTIGIQRIHAQREVVTVEYYIHNIGTAPIPAGFPVTIVYMEPDGSASDQEYAIEVPVPPGQSGAKHLTVEGAVTHAPGDTCQLWLTGDGGGAAEKAFQFMVNWESADEASATPA